MPGFARSLVLASPGAIVKGLHALESAEVLPISIGKPCGQLLSQQVVALADIELLPALLQQLIVEFICLLFAALQIIHFFQAGSLSLLWVFAVA